MLSQTTKQSRRHRCPTPLLLPLLFITIITTTLVQPIKCGSSNNNNNSFEPKISLPPKCSHTPSSSISSSHPTNPNPPLYYYYTHPRTSKWTPLLYPSCESSNLTPSSILSLCQSTYPTHTITNIVSIQTPPKLLTPRKKSSPNQPPPPQNYQTYRCLLSPFQSDALLVPSPCIFDHIHNGSICEGSEYWNLTAVNNCANRGNTKIESFAVLLPCGVGKFSGVEFVCCPKRGEKKKVDENVNKWDDENKIEDEEDQDEEDQDEAEDDQNEDDQDSDDDYYDDEEDSDEDDDSADEDNSDEEPSPPSWPIKKNSKRNRNRNNKKLTTTTTTTSPPTIDPYLSNPPPPQLEHNSYTRALSRLSTSLKHRLSSLLSTWSSLESKYQNLRKTNPSQAEEFKRTVTNKFQKTIKKLEEEGEAEKLQLRAVHEGRVLRHMDEIKKESLSCVEKEVGKLRNNPAAGEQNNNNNEKSLLRPCYQKLFRSLHKDRHHTLAHFKHSLTNIRHFGPETNSEHLNELRDLTLNRLVGISNTTRESLQLLSSHPQISLTLRPLIEDYVLSLQGRDDLPGGLLVATRDSDEKLIRNLEGMIRGVTTTTTTTTTETFTPTPTPQIIIDDRELIGDIENKENNNNNAAAPGVGAASYNNGADPVGENELEDNDDNADAEMNHETEYLPIPSHKKHEVNNLNGINTEEKTFTIHRETYPLNPHSPTHSSYSSPLTLTLILCVSALISSLAVGSGVILMKRRKNRRHGHAHSNKTMNHHHSSSNHGGQIIYEGIENSCPDDMMLDKSGPYKTTTFPSNVIVPLLQSPEEKHVQNMQMRGYENPTYKYFEK